MSRMRTMRSLEVEPHWKLVQYDNYIQDLKALIKTEISPAKRTRLETLLQGWMDWREEFEAELAVVERRATCA